METLNPTALSILSALAEDDLDLALLATAEMAYLVAGGLVSLPTSGTVGVSGPELTLAGWTEVSERGLLADMSAEVVLFHGSTETYAAELNLRSLRFEAEYAVTRHKSRNPDLSVRGEVRFYARDLPEPIASFAVSDFPAKESKAYRVSPIVLD